MRDFLRILTLFSISVFFQAKLFAQDTVSFYFSAHQDDWQLFMNPNAWNDVQRDSSKVVFVYLTAGDAGLKLGNGGRSYPYYLAREEGAKLSVKFMVDAKNIASSAVQSSASFHGHAISKWIYGNTVTYFFRLPDGNPRGTGYANTAHHTLYRLKNGATPGIIAVDSSTNYRGWNDLTATIRALIDQERGNASNVWVNMAETDTVRNPRDHSDHLHTAYAVLDAVKDLSCINKSFYVEYQTARMPENLSSSEREIETGTFGAMVAGLTMYDHRSAFDRLHRSWLGRQYFRTEPAKGKCVVR